MGPIEAQLLAVKAASPKTTGIRWILDYDGPFDPEDKLSPTHVACSRIAHTRHGGDYLREPAAAALFERGFGLLAKHGLSFDLQCCPAQVGFGASDGETCTGGE